MEIISVQIGINDKNIKQTYTNNPCLNKSYTNLYTGEN